MLEANSDPLPVKWAKVIDHESCIGCHACTTACKSENEVPLGVTRTYVKAVDVGVFPQVRRAFQVTRCNQCEDSPCTVACPTSAMYRRDDGIVDFDKSICIGCKACIAACPYDAIFINPEDGAAEKCNFCAHRLEMDLEPACVTVCPTQAIMVGDLNDPGSLVSKMVHREAVAVRRPEKETKPKLFYRGAHQATLDPLAARRPGGGIFMWSEQDNRQGRAVAGNPEGEAGSNSSAAAILSYDVAHSVPWDWRVSLYTLTKGISSGVYVVASLLVLLGGISAAGALWSWAVPALALVFLAITGGLLIWDLEHPERFYLIFTRPQWKSWLVKGAFMIAGFSVVLVAHCAAGWMQMTWLVRGLIVPGLPLAVLAAVYTAFLFAQAKARDLWQSPLLPPHLLIQAAVAGSAALLPVAQILEPQAVESLSQVLAATGLVHLLCVWGESSLPRVTAHSRLAHREMTHGGLRHYYRIGWFLIAVAITAPWSGPVVAPLALVGLLAFEHAWVQAGQSVPLA